LSNLLTSNTPRSRQALAAYLQANQDPIDSGGSWASGAAQLGSKLTNAFIAKKLMQKDLQEENTKNAAIAKLLRGDADAAPDGFDPSAAPAAPGGDQGITWNQPRQENPQLKQQLLAQALGPEQALRMRLQNEQQANAPFNLGPNEQRFQGGKSVASNLITPKAETFKVGATREFQRGNQKVTQEFDGTAWKDIASGAAFKPDDGAGYRSLTKEEAGERGLDPLGTYQIATTGPNAGKIDVVTQPKQTNPTEAQQKYAYNARRLADAMGAAKKAIEADSGAVTSGTLEATQDNPIPGVAWAGRQIAGNQEQIVRNNLGDAIDAALTLGTGAAYNKEQLDAARAGLLPRAGEEPPVLADKFRKMQVLYEQAKVNAHSAGVDLPDPEIFKNIYKVPGTKSSGATGGWSITERK